MTEITCPLKTVSDIARVFFATTILRLFTPTPKPCRKLCWMDNDNVGLLLGFSKSLTAFSFRYEFLNVALTWPPEIRPSVMDVELFRVRSMMLYWPAWMNTKSGCK